MKKILAALAALALIPAPAHAANRMAISFPGYDNRADTLENFPALIVFTNSASGDSFSFENTPFADGDCHDLRFFDEQSEMLEYEIDTHVPGEALLVWVKIPELRPDGSTFISAVWGDSNDEQLPCTTNGAVWAGYAGVWHMNEASGQILDSTANRLHGDRGNNIAAAPGVASGSQYLDGNGNFHVGHNAALNLGDSFTVSGWFRYPGGHTPGNNWRRFFNKKNGWDAGHGWEVEKLDNAHNVLRPRGANGQNQDIHMPGGMSFDNDPREWYLLTFQYHGNSSGSVYVNGVLAGHTTFGGGAATDNGEPFYIGGTRGNGGENWEGFVDEVRIGKAVRSADWVAAEYATMAVPGFSAFGPIQPNNAPIVFALPATSVRSVSAVANGNLVQLGEGAENADVYCYYATNNTPGGPLDWGCAPLSKESLGKGAFFFELTGLEPGTEYQYCFLASNLVEGAWSKAVRFKTHGDLPEIAMLSAAAGLAYATVDVRIDWACEATDLADILLLYGPFDYGDDADEWLENGALSVFRADYGVGEHAFSLFIPDAGGTYYCRAFGINGFGTNAAPEGVAFYSQLAQARASGLNPNWVWSGLLSTSWKEPGNWINAANYLPPQTIGELLQDSNQNLLIGMGPHLPLDQDIEGLAVNELQVAGLARHITVGGEPFAVSRFNCRDSAGGTFNVEFLNDIAVDSNGGTWELPWTLHLVFQGTLSETGGPKHLYAWNVHFCGPVLFSGGIRDSISFYHPKAAGVSSDPPNPVFYSGNLYFNPPGTADGEYDLPEGNGWMAGGAMVLADGVVAVLNGPVTGGGNLNLHGNGILELAAPTNNWTGNYRSEHNGLLILRGEIPETNASIDRTNGNPALDLDGQDLLGRELTFHDRGGHNNDGHVRNQNPDKTSRFSGNLPYGVGYASGGYHFGGVGDLLFSGDITTAEDGSPFTKVGPGTLTMTGSSVFQGGTRVFGGSLVLDHSNNNAPKIANNTVWLSGNLTLLGNKENDTEQTVGPLDVCFGGYYKRVRISAAGQDGHSATLRFANLGLAGATWDSGTMVDFAPVSNATIRTSATGNHHNLQHQAISMRATYKGESFARVSSTDVVDGYAAIEPAPPGAYLPNFDGAYPHGLVDLADDTSLDEEIKIGGLRFSTAAPVTLTLNSDLKLLGEGDDNTHGYLQGAILVTPAVGENDITINGPGRLQNGWHSGESTFFIHQYNTLAPLIINTSVGSGGTGFTKAGPGEVIFNNHDNPLIFVHLHEGVLTIPSIADTLDASPLGRATGDRSSDLSLGDATLRYKGTDPQGHSTNRRIRLHGFGVVEASGDGPLVFTHDVPFYPWGVSGNYLLTLSGKTEGVVTGAFDLRGGRLRKRGTGTWTLAETSHSSCIWGADVMEGTLVLDGSFGRNITVYSGGTLKGAGLVRRNLIVKKDGAVYADPDAVKLLKVGNNLVIEKGAKLALPKPLSSDWKPVLEIHGKIIGEFEKPNHAYVDYDHVNGLVSVKFRPTGTLLMVR